MKKSVFVLLAAAALASCAESSLNEGPVIDTGEIQVKSVAYDVTTRAPYEGDDLVANPLTARVISSKNDAFAAPVHSDGTMVFNQKGAVQYTSIYSGDSKYPNSGGLFLFGLHPADFTKWDGSATSYTYTFSGKEDVMAAQMEEYTAQNSPKTLLFKHLLTRLDVKLQAGAAAPNTFGAIKGISLSEDNSGAKVCNTITYDAANGTAGLGVKNATIDFWAMSADADGNKIYSDDAFTTCPLPSSATGDYCAYAMVAPVQKNIAAGEVIYYLAIDTEKKGIKYVDVKLEKALTTGSSAGYAYDVTVRFTTTNEIEAVASVTPWIDGGNATGEITE